MVEEIPQVAVSYTAAGAIHVGNTDKLAIFFHPQALDDYALPKLLGDIRIQVTKRVGINPTYLIPVDNHW